MNMKTQISKIILLLSLVLGFTLSACGGEETPIPEPVESMSLDIVVAEGHLLPAQSSWLNFATQGRVDEILVGEGEQVSKGQVLMRLANREQAEVSLLAAELELTHARHDYDDFLRLSELATAKAWQDYLGTQLQRAEAEREWEDLNIEILEDEIGDARVEVLDREDDLENAQEEWEKYLDVDMLTR
jgi:multidrug efflux pump subunit AcrA (membrane-fusion protein)